MLSIPQYILTANIASNSARYTWDEWDVRGHFMFEDPAQLARFGALTNKANTALAIAIGEWICERFRPLDADPRPLQFLEAAWAGNVRIAYCHYTHTVDDEWRGPVRAPLALTITIVNDALFGLSENAEVSVRVCWMYNLALHVLPQSDAFKAWLEACVIRLEHEHARVSEPKPPLDEATELFAVVPWQGQVVPREAFDPAFPYERAAAPGLIDRFLSSLRASENPYLRSQEEAGALDPEA
jgi:hypothetical protein